MEKIITYRCSGCGQVFDTEQACLDHEACAAALDIRSADLYYIRYTFGTFMPTEPVAEERLHKNRLQLKLFAQGWAPTTRCGRIYLPTLSYIAGKDGISEKEFGKAQLGRNTGNGHDFVYAVFWAEDNKADAEARHMLVAKLQELATDRIKLLNAGIKILKEWDEMGDTNE